MNVVSYTPEDFADWSPKKGEQENKNEETTKRTVLVKANRLG